MLRDFGEKVTCVGLCSERCPWHDGTLSDDRNSEESKRHQPLAETKRESLVK